MKRKRARFDVVTIEITVHCPWCQSTASAPLTMPPRFIWNVDDIRRALDHDVPCVPCGRKYRLHHALKSLLAPSTEPVSTERRVSKVAQVEIICANCAGDEQQPKLTLMTTTQTCAGCGGTNFELVRKPETADTVTESIS
jgi:hypothetical protein